MGVFCDEGFETVDYQVLGVGEEVFCCHCVLSRGGGVGNGRLCCNLLREDCRVVTRGRGEGSKNEELKVLCLHSSVSSETPCQGNEPQMLVFGV